MFDVVSSGKKLKENIPWCEAVNYAETVIEKHNKEGINWSIQIVPNKTDTSVVSAVVGS